MNIVLFLFAASFITVFIIFLKKAKNTKFVKFEEECGKVRIYENAECGVEHRTFFESYAPPYVRFSLYNNFIVLSLSHIKAIYYDDLYSVQFKESTFFDEIRLIYGKKVGGLKITLDVIIENGREPYEIIKQKYQKING